MKTKGTLFKRTISNKEYYYHQYLLDGHLKSKTISESEYYRLGFETYFPGEDVEDFLSHSFQLDVHYGASLYALGRPYRPFKKRFCYEQVHSFLDEGAYTGKVLILYGLRRTGKTTLTFQAINDLSIKDFARAAYIKCNEGDTIYKLFEDLKYLTEQGFFYIFIDEITLLEDFVALSSTISDIYGLMAKIVLSGTDSLGFLIASHHNLYDRYKMIHTTYISFKEFSMVLGISSIDRYIEYGGTMSMEGVDYNKTVRSGPNELNEYVDSSIIHNIIHSIKNVDGGKYFFHLYDLYERHELENVINRIIEDRNHRFAISIIEQDFKSHDYGSLKQLLSLPNNYERFHGVLDGVDETKLVQDLMDALNIINKEKQTHKIDDAVLQELEQYLRDLDIIATIDEVIYPSFATKKHVVFTQPGLRYAQAKTLVEILLNDEKLRQHDAVVLTLLKEKLLSDVKGRMIEDLIIYETSLLHRDTFKLYFGVKGEFDMVVLHDDITSSIYEIKHSSETNALQYKNLIDIELNGIFERKYYPIKERAVLYRGEPIEENGITFQNIEQFLING